MRLLSGNCISFSIFTLFVFEFSNEFSAATNRTATWDAVTKRFPAVFVITVKRFFHINPLSQSILMKKYSYRNKDGELSWHDKPAPRARMRTLPSRCIEHAATQTPDTSASTLPDAPSAPQNAFENISRHCVSTDILRALKRRLVALSSGSRVAFSTCLKARL
jgi:hypothetical protein